MNKEIQNSPLLWNQINTKNLSLCSIRGELFDTSGVYICTFKPTRKLGEGTFGTVDAFDRIHLEEVKKVAIKRPKFHESKLLLEALFQKKLHNDLLEFGLGGCVPEVYDIFVYQPTGDIWFSMEFFEPLLVSEWCKRADFTANPLSFVKLLLQLALILEVFETELRIDHRDLKINNMIIVDEPIKIYITWKGIEKTVEFPFRVVLIDFGFACIQSTIDIKDTNTIPPLHACPKHGRNMFQILVSLWNIKSLRNHLEPSWGDWIRKKITTIHPPFSCIRLIEWGRSLDWMYLITEHESFRAPLCAPSSIIRECMKMIE